MIDSIGTWERTLSISLTFDLGMAAGSELTLNPPSTIFLSWENVKESKIFFCLSSSIYHHPFMTLDDGLDFGHWSFIHWSSCLSMTNDDRGMEVDWHVRKVYFRFFLGRRKSRVPFSPSNPLPCFCYIFTHKVHYFEQCSSRHCCIGTRTQTINSTLH